MFGGAGMLLRTWGYVAILMIGFGGAGWAQHYSSGDSYPPPGTYPPPSQSARHPMLRSLPSSEDSSTHDPEGRRWRATANPRFRNSRSRDARFGAGQGAALAQHSAEYNDVPVGQHPVEQEEDHNFNYVPAEQGPYPSQIYEPNRNVLPKYRFVNPNTQDTRAYPTIPSHTYPEQPDSLPAGRTGAVNFAVLPPDMRPETGARRSIPPKFQRTVVDYYTKEPAGTIIIDTPNTYLYFVLGRGQAIRYGIGVGREGFTWAGTQRVSKMAEWPDWHPPEQMIRREPYLPRFMAGGDGNPLGARALYLGNTLFRIHGTNRPATIGTFVSSGCIRLTNEDITDLYSRVKVGTRVVVRSHPNPPRATKIGTPAQVTFSDYMTPAR
jgi:lipoprotein-anchoring transpeptidase ErfK/SrfK